MEQTVANKVLRKMIKYLIDYHILIKWFLSKHHIPIFNLPFIPQDMKTIWNMEIIFKFVKPYSDRKGYDQFDFVEWFNANGKGV